MTVDMLVGGFIILIMVGVVVVTMTSAKNVNSGRGTIEDYRRRNQDPDNRR